MTIRAQFRATAIATSVSLVFASGAMAENFALVVGIDDYLAQPRLTGAVNDAQYIADSLRRFGVSEMTVLLNKEATKNNVTGAFQNYLNLAQPGDTLIFTYAGHGFHVDDENGDEASPSDPNDNQDETLVLTNFSQQYPDDHIIDDELAIWFSDADARGINVVFVSDSCHSGTVMRGGKTRMLDEYAVDVKPVVPDIARGEVEAEETPDSLVFLAGSTEAETVQEVVIDGRNHGALSYAFGNAIREMKADRDADGGISRDELSTYVSRAAKAYNDGRRLPEMVARGGTDFAVLTPDLDAIIDTPDESTNGGSASTLPPVDYDKVPLTSRPDLVWDRTTRNITDSNGEIVAANVDENRLPDVDAKFELLEIARAAVLENGFDLRIVAGSVEQPERLVLGDLFSIEIGPLPHPYLTVFNLANNGEVQLIFPYEPSEREAQRIGGMVRFDLRAGQPIGIDHVVAIATEEPPQTLRQQLNWSMSTETFLETVGQLVYGDGVSTALSSVATVER